MYQKNKGFSIQQKNEIPEVVKNFIWYYHNERLQEKIQELAPIQFRKQVLAKVSFYFLVRFDSTGYTRRCFK